MSRSAARLLPALLLVGLLAARPGAAADVPADTDLAVGDRGVALSAIDGQNIVEIPVKYIGSYKDFIGPGYDIHLVQLEGPVAERVGVAAGMSGSPVYFGGRLIGALSYRLGLLPREPIAGVTLIEDILDASKTGVSASPSPNASASPIGTPLMVAGMLGPVRQWLDQRLEDSGFVLVGGGSAESSSGGPAELVPGSPVGVQLVRGDLRIAATGTVTWVDEERVYAFGHPFLGAGRVEMPMVSAEVIHTLADMAGSVKLASVGDEIGAIVEDRLTAIVGDRNRKARMIPVELNVSRTGYGDRTYHFELARSATLTPLLAGAVVANALIASTGYEQLGTLRATGTVRLADLPDLPIEMAFAGEGASNPSLSLAVQLQQTLVSLWSNPFEELSIESVDLDVTVDTDVAHYYVDSLLFDRAPLRPGGTLDVGVVLLRYRGDRVTRRLTLPIPAETFGDEGLSLVVGSPRQVERALGNPTARRVQSAEDLQSMIVALGELRSSHRLVAVLFRSRPGMVSRGAAYDQLPPTAERLLSAADTAPRDNRRLRISPLALAELELDGPVEGGRTEPLRIDAGLDKKETDR